VITVERWRYLQSYEYRLKRAKEELTLHVGRSRGAGGWCPFVANAEPREAMIRLVSDLREELEKHGWVASLRDWPDGTVSVNWTLPEWAELRWRRQTAGEVLRDGLALVAGATRT